METIERARRWYLQAADEMVAQRAPTDLSMVAAGSGQTDDPAYLLYRRAIACMISERNIIDRFKYSVSPRWAEDRARFWCVALRETAELRLGERLAIAAGSSGACRPEDPRRFSRLMDGITVDRYSRWDRRRSFDWNVSLVEAYHRADAVGEAGYALSLAGRPRIFSLPLPAGPGYRYPCILCDIRLTATAIPEYDLEGIGIATLGVPDDRRRTCIYLPAVRSPAPSDDCALRAEVRLHGQRSILEQVGRIVFTRDRIRRGYKRELRDELIEKHARWHADRFWENRPSDRR